MTIATETEYCGSLRWLRGSTSGCLIYLPRPLAATNEGRTTEVRIFLQKCKEATDKTAIILSVWPPL